MNLQKAFIFNLLWSNNYLNFIIWIKWIQLQLLTFIKYDKWERLQMCGVTLDESHMTAQLASWLCLGPWNRHRLIIHMRMSL